MITKKISFYDFLKIILITILLFFAFKFYQSTPLESIFKPFQAVFLGLMLIFSIIYIVNKIIKHGKLNKIIFYYLLIVFFLPIYSAYIAKSNFGQPILYGILAQRQWFVIGVGIWFYYMIVTYKLSIETIEKAFLFMMWVSLIIFTFVVITFNPQDLQNAEELKRFVHFTQDRGIRFKFQNFFITFGAIYYFIKYSEKRKIIDFIILIILWAYILFVIKGRTYMLFLITTYLIYIWYRYTPTQKFMFIVKSILGVFIFLIIMQTLFPTYFNNMLMLFGDMFKVLMGEKSNDSSANARIFETLIVLNYFKNNSLSIIFGVGKLSHQWNGGFNGVFGYFYPVDIGIVGGFFLYGILGFIILYLIPIIFVFKIIKKVSNENNLFIRTLQYLLIHSVIASVLGGYYFNYWTYIVPLFILLGYLQIKGNVYEKLSKS